MKELSINDITIMGYGKSIRAGAHYNRLDIIWPAGTSSGVAVMTDGYIPGELT